MRDDQLHMMISTARAHAAVDARRRRRWLRRQLDEDLTFAQICRQAVDAGDLVELMVAGGRRHRGHVVVTTDELVAVATDGGSAYITMASIVGVRALGWRAADDPAAAPGPFAPRPTNAVVRAPTLHDLLFDLGEQQHPVTICTVDGRTHRGRVAGVGRDVVCLDDDGTYLRIAAISEVVAA